MGPDLNISALSATERLRLIEKLWESLCADPAQIPVSDAQKMELDRRLDEVDAGDRQGIPWEDVLRRIRGRES